MGEISVKVLLFASAREAAGTGETTLRVDESTDTTSIRAILAQQYPRLAKVVLDEESLTLALNEEYVVEVTRLKNNDTIALIPPISGG